MNKENCSPKVNGIQKERRFNITLRLNFGVLRCSAFTDVTIVNAWVLLCITGRTSTYLFIKKVT